MAHDLEWDRKMLGAFLANAILTEEEKLILDDWIKGESITYTTMMHPQNPMSVAKVNRIRKRIRQKYDQVQVYTADLPKRKTK